MILARCPACSTTFRVRPEQLNARQGRVRCGQCNHAFNALESTVEEGPSPALSDAETDIPFFFLEEKLPDEGAPGTGKMAVNDNDSRPPDTETKLPAEREEIAFLLEAEAEFPEEPVVTPIQQEEGRIEPAGEIGTEAAQEWPPMETAMEDIPALPVAYSSAGDEVAPPPPHLTDTHGDAPVDFDALIHTRDVAPVFLPPAPRPSHRADGHIPRVEEAEEEAASPPAFSEEEASPALGQAAWAAAATLLVLAFLAQGVLVFRNDIAQSSPQMRPFMEGLCAGLGCELPLPRDPAAIAIESSDIQPDAGREAFFTLHATLRNRAEFQQAWPHLEITLTDARDKALVRRVLDPSQWLPADAPRDAFPARREVTSRVSFEAPGVAAAGYRVYAFYP